VLSGRNRSEIIGKNPKNFRWEYCFHVPAISGAFLPEPARNFRPGNDQNNDPNNDQYVKLMMLVDFVNENDEASFKIGYKNYGRQKIFHYHII
jgi:hypothetical protein